jgi:hypothetical protein
MIHFKLNIKYGIRYYEINLGRAIEIQTNHLDIY